VGFDEVVDVRVRSRGVHAAAAGDDVVQRRIDVLGHPLGVTAHVEVCAVLRPAEQLPGFLPHALLDRDFGITVGPVAGECHVEPGQGARLHETLEFVAVEEVRLPPSVAEEQPGPPRCIAGLAFLQGAAERRDARPWADHDDRHVGGGQAEGVVRSQMHPDRIAAVGQERRGDAAVSASPDVVAHVRHRQVHVVGAERLRSFRVAGSRGHQRLQCA
jgi:hypothetical protein